MPEEMKFTSNPDAARNLGVHNPYALAELVAGRTIPWKTLPNAPEVLSDILQTPYAELFDPVHEGPLYAGLKLDADLRIVRARSPLFDVKLKLDVSDLENPTVVEEGDIKTLADLRPRFDVNDVGTVEVRRADFVGSRDLQLVVRVPDRQKFERLAAILTKDILESITFDPEQEGSKKDWTPPNGTWSDPGRFFNEAAEFFDPIQGAVANCYYIAALSAVAWAEPYRIQHMTRATGQSQQQFTNMIRFYKPDSNGTLDKEIEVTDAVPLNTSSGNFIYCRSSEAGEIWPAVYEKAFAKLVTGTSGDRPDITATGWGDCVRATAQLTGQNRFYYDTASRSATELWNIVRSNSRSFRTFKPMTCWTYSSGTASEKKIVYGDANIVASHCYTVLGWASRDGKQYIVLRNPWGNTEATVSTLSGNISLYDISWWRPISLATVDGTFAIEAPAFKTYFAGLGVVK